MRDYFSHSAALRFVFPIDGDCLNAYDGKEEDGILFITARVEAAADTTVMINNIPAAYQNGFFEAEIPIADYRTEITAADGMGNSQKITVLRLLNATGIFRLSSDDNILCLQDIHQNRAVYTSIFDNPYLAVYREAHEKYGATVQLNIHWEYDANNPYFSDGNRKSFDLSMMTDRFREEFEQNAHWLRLSFHAREPQSVSPYADTPGEVIAADAARVYREVVRFAGESALSRHNTTIHYADCRIESMRAMHDLGLRGAYGYFDLDRHGTPIVSYRYPKELVEHIHGRDFWYDTAEDILYGKIDLVLNLCRAEEVVPLLEKLQEDPHRRGCVELMIHEQYFYPDYVRYMPTFRENVLTACRWCAEQGYRGYYMQDIME